MPPPAPSPLTAPRNAAEMPHNPGPRRVCLCGSALTQPARGRHRQSCSGPCRRRRQNLTRQLQRRHAWSKEWQRQATAGLIPADTAATQIADVTADIEELRTWLGEEHVRITP